MIAKTDTQHYSDIADSVRYSLDGTQYESSLSQARAEIEEDNGYFSDISTAVQSKTGQAEPYDKDELASTISNELTVHVEEKAVNFYDYDGTVLYSYTATEALALSSLPTLPTHSGLVAQKWNMTLAEVKAYAQADKKVNIGCLYDTDDGSTKLYLKVVAGVALPSTELRLRLSPQSSLTVEWGDGTSSVVSNSSSSWQDKVTNHNYTEAETDEEICIRISGDEFELNKTSEQYSIFNNKVLPLVRLNIGSNCSAINFYAFNGCYSLTSVTIPDGVTSIGGSAFGNCYSLTSISIPGSVTSIGNNAFNHCYSLTSISIPDGVTSIGDGDFIYCNSLTSISIPGSVTSIGNGAFNHCYSLTSISIPGSVTSIGQQAFGSCYNLTSISIPDGVTSIGQYAFNGCSSLISVTIPDSVTSIGGTAFSGCSSLTSISIPDGVKSIGQYAFSYCFSLTSVTIPDSVTSIGQYAFGTCYSLTSISIPGSVTSIGNNAFGYCYSLTSVTIHDGVKSIGQYAFSDCKNLLLCIIPNSVTSIASSVFYNNTNLQKVDLSDFTDPTAIPTLANTNAFTNVPGKFIVANAEMLEAFRAKTNWSSFASTKWEVKT